jgi:rhodanese-related sulfurtransferase
LIHIPSENNITVEEFDILYKENKDDYALIDVRPPVQYGIVSLPGSVNIPLK